MRYAHVYELCVGCIGVLLRNTGLEEVLKAAFDDLLHFLKRRAVQSRTTKL